jgi:acyl dehydratase
VKTNPDSSRRPQAPWSIVARNLPEHANNSIHTDEGARAAGFERALVAGVTTYAYCLHPVIQHFGLDWLVTGEAEVRFRAPVFDGDQVSFPLKSIESSRVESNDKDRDDQHDQNDQNDQNDQKTEYGVEVEAWVDRSARPLVAVSAWRNHREQPHPSAKPRPGEQLETVNLRLEGEYGSQYAQRSGNLEDQCAKARVVHPGVWPSLGNYVFHRQLARGSWIHTRSIVRQFAAVADGVEAEISSTVIERFLRGGERAVADVVVRVEGRVVAAIEHEAIIDLGRR